MPLSIPARSTSNEVVPSFAAVTGEAQKGEDVSQELEKLKTYLSHQNKGGTLAIRTKWFSNKQEMYRMQWYHHLFSSWNGAEQQKKAVNYIQSLLGENTSTDGKQSQVLSQALAGFVAPALSQLNNELSTLKTVRYERLFQSLSLLNPQKIPGIEDQNEERAPHKPIVQNFLKSQDIILADKPMGKGGQAEVYKITYQDNKADYLYKELRDPVLISDRENLESGHRFDLIAGDIAAAQCKLPNIVESVGFFLQIIKNPTDIAESGAIPDMDYHYLPNTTQNEAKQYATTLHLEHPKAEIFLCGQIMKRASGVSLKDFINRDDNDSSDNKLVLDTNPKKTPLKKILYGLYSFLKAARDKNFVHYDIKPDNLIFDEATAQLTVIDTTSGRVIGPISDQETMNECDTDSLSSSKRETSIGSFREAIVTREKNMDMTLAYAHPAAMAASNKDRSGTLIDTQNEECGTEYDCFSTAMTLLHLISKVDFEKYEAANINSQPSRASNVQALSEKWGKNPNEYLGKYLEWVKGEDDVDSETSRILKDNPDFKSCLQLLFEGSASGEAGEKAFEKLATDPYMISCKEASLQATAA